MLLKIEDLRVNYGNVEALHGINLDVDEGEIVTILGANGAAFCLSGERLAAFLYSGIRLDAELALAQFRKSLRRSLPFLGMAELPEGRALGLDLGYEGAAGLLERFLAE